MNSGRQRESAREAKQKRRDAQASAGSSSRQHVRLIAATGVFPSPARVVVVGFIPDFMHFLCWDPVFVCVCELIVLAPTRVMSAHTC